MARRIELWKLISFAATPPRSGGPHGRNPDARQRRRAPRPPALGALQETLTILLASDSSHSYKGISINGSGTYNFSAPTSGPNEALLIVGDRTTASSLGSTITGTSTTQFNGVIYLPKEALTYTGAAT